MAAGERSWNLSGDIDLAVGRVLAEVAPVEGHLTVQAVQHHDSQAPQVD